jgi:hypothetical protein
MSKRWISSALYMPDSWFHNVLWIIVVFGCIFGLSSNQLRHWERGSYISEVHSDDLATSNWEKHRSLYWVCGSEVKKRGDLLDDLKETFNNLRKYKMMLNPKKYVFGVSFRKLFGYLVSSRRIDVNLKKVEAIEQLQSPWTQKEIQKLAGMMATLSQFISMLGECGMPFYKLLRKQMNFSGMIKRQWLSSSSSNIWSPYQHWFHQSLMMWCSYMW